jgi:hypothetical protein
VVFAGLEDDGDEAGISKSVNGSPTPNLAAADQPRAKVLTVESRELPDDTQTWLHPRPASGRTAIGQHVRFFSALAQGLAD